MALTQITFCQVGFLRYGGAFPMTDGDGTGVASQNFTPSGSNQQSAAAPTLNPTHVRIATDTAIYVAIGASPDATVTTARFWMPANSVEYFQIEAGNKVGIAT